MLSVAHYEIWKDNRMVKRLENKAQVRGFIKVLIMMGAEPEDYDMYYCIGNTMDKVTDDLIRDVTKNP